MFNNVNANEFIILKRISKKASSLNCMVKISKVNDNFSFSGELFCNLFSPNDYQLLLYSNDKVYVLSNFENCKFKVDINADILGGFALLLIENQTKTPLLFHSFNLNVLPEDIVKKLTDTANYQEYDDYLIADKNYYEGEVDDAENIYFKTTNREDKYEEEQEKEETAYGTTLYENFTNDEKQNYYFSVKEKLNEIFREKVADEELKKIIPNSKFVKINYNETSFYSVGIVYENNVEKYICYAVKGNYSKMPSELSKYCSFVPLSNFKQLDEGYFIIFQSTITGEIIKN